MEVTVSFKTKKVYNRFMRNYHSNKGTNLSPKNCDLMHDGGSFLSGLKSIGKDIGKKALKEVVKGGVKGVKGLIKESAPNGVFGQIANGVADVGLDFASGQINKKVDGLGMIPLAGRNHRDQWARVQAFQAQQAQGSGFMDVAKSMAKKAVKSKIGKDLMKQGINAMANQASTYIPQSGMAGVIGNTINNAVKQEAVKQVEGMGMSAGIPYNSLGGNGLAQNVSNINDKMARVRSFKKGGSFRLP